MAVAPPCIVPVTPPESPASVTPGIIAWMALTLREDGIARRASLSSICCCRVLCTSTIGDSPVTVTVSWSSPTLRSAFTVATKLPDSSMPSRLTVVKPGSVNVSE
jgi:hypothetical protein